MAETFAESWISLSLFSTISITAFLGNLLVIWVILKKRERCFARPFEILILSLAGSDALAAIFLAFSRFLYRAPLSQNYTQAYLYCTTLWGAYILFSLGYISIYTCLALTIERWMAVVKPQAYHRFQKKQAFATIAMIWIWGFVLNLPAFVTTDADMRHEKCIFIHLHYGGVVLPVLQILLTCIVPFIVIIALYWHIFHIIKRMPLILRGASGIALKKRLTVLALVSSILLVIGWLPTQISYSLDIIGVTKGIDRQSTLYNIFIMMTLLNCIMNPIIYGIFSSRCRQEYLSVLRGLPEEKMNSQSTTKDFTRQ